MQIKLYNPRQEKEWDNFVHESSNGIFQYYRNYMEYHADRFDDYSLMFYKDNHLVGLLPANIENDIVHSHKGLSFGGLVHHQASLGAEQQLKLFELIIQYLKQKNIRKFIYKAIPMIYHKHPTQTDLYFLNHLDDIKIETLLSTTIDLKNPGTLKYRRKRGINKANKSNMLMQENKHWPEMWEMLAIRLSERHKASPTHTLAEIQSLQQSFPEHIKLYAATIDNKIMAGIVVYQTQQVVHAQYISTSEQGCQLGALDFLINGILEKYQNKVRYFDFGISTEDRGKRINYGLVKQKEEFGGASTIHQIYHIDIN